MATVSESPYLHGGVAARVDNFPSSKSLDGHVDLREEEAGSILKSRTAHKTAHRGATFAQPLSRPVLPAGAWPSPPPAVPLPRTCHSWAATHLRPIPSDRPKVADNETARKGILPPAHPQGRYEAAYPDHFLIATHLQARPSHPIPPPCKARKFPTRPRSVPSPCSTIHVNRCPCKTPPRPAGHMTAAAFSDSCIASDKCGPHRCDRRVWRRIHVPYLCGEEKFS